MILYLETLSVMLQEAPFYHANVADVITYKKTSTIRRLTLRKVYTGIQLSEDI